MLLSFFWLHGILHPLGFGDSQSIAPPFFYVLVRGILLVVAGDGEKKLFRGTVTCKENREKKSPLCFSCIVEISLVAGSKWFIATCLLVC
jgi:hypothetical protein